MLEFEIIDYYRLARHHLMHNPIGEQDKVHLSQQNRILQMKGEKFASLLAPNPIDSMQFDDFILLSRVAKQMTRSICALTAPSAEEFFSVLRKNIKLIKTLRGTAQNKRRVKEKLASYLHTEFGFDGTEELVEELLGMRLLAQ